jgi:putative thioredoxin
MAPIFARAAQALEPRARFVKVNVDENSRIAQQFQVQSIPAVYALKDGRVVDGFIGAQGEPQVQAFVDRLVPTAEEDEVARLLAAGDEASIRKALDLEPGHEAATTMLAELLVADGRSDEALALLEEIPESAETRHIAALARQGVAGAPADVEQRLDALLDQVKADDDARREFLDLLELLGPDDPRTGDYRRQLTARLF